MKNEMKKGVVPSSLSVQPPTVESVASIPRQAFISQRRTMRKGKWTNEEEAFTARIIHHFNCGVLQLPEGTTLRAYLAEKLECDPMRITKKFTGSNCLGKRVYHSCERTPATFEEIKVANAELAVLEARFHSQLERNKERKAGLMNMEARLLNSGQIVSSTTIDAMVRQGGIGMPSTPIGLQVNQPNGWSHVLQQGYPLPAGYTMPHTGTQGLVPMPNLPIQGQHRFMEQHPRGPHIHHTQMRAVTGVPGSQTTPALPMTPGMTTIPHSPPPNGMGPNGMGPQAYLQAPSGQLQNPHWGTPVPASIPRGLHMGYLHYQQQMPQHMRGGYTQSVPRPSLAQQVCPMLGAVPTVSSMGQIPNGVAPPGLPPQSAQQIQPQQHQQQQPQKEVQSTQQQQQQQQRPQQLPQPQLPHMHGVSHMVGVGGMPFMHSMAQSGHLSYGQAAWDQWGHFGKQSPPLGPGLLQPVEMQSLESGVSRDQTVITPGGAQGRTPSLSSVAKAGSSGSFPEGTPADPVDMEVSPVSKLEAHSEDASGKDGSNSGSGGEDVASSSGSTKGSLGGTTAETLSLGSCSGRSNLDSSGSEEASHCHSHSERKSFSTKLEKKSKSAGANGLSSGSSEFGSESSSDDSFGTSASKLQTHSSMPEGRDRECHGSKEPGTIHKHGKSLRSPHGMHIPSSGGKGSEFGKAKSHRGQEDEEEEDEEEEEEEQEVHVYGPPPSPSRKPDDQSSTSVDADSAGGLLMSFIHTVSKQHSISQNLPQKPHYPHPFSRLRHKHRERERNEKSLGDGRVAGEGTGGVSSDSGGGESSHASMDGSSGGCDIGGTSSGSRSDSSRSNGGSKRSRDKTSSHPMPRKHRLQMPSGGGSSRRDRDNRRLSLLTSASRQCHPRPGSTLGGVSEGGGGGGDGGGGGVEGAATPGHACLQGQQPPQLGGTMPGKGMGDTGEGVERTTKKRKRERLTSPAEKSSGEHSVGSLGSSGGVLGAAQGGGGGYENDMEGSSSNKDEGSNSGLVDGYENDMEGGSSNKEAGSNESGSVTSTSSLPDGGSDGYGSPGGLVWGEGEGDTEVIAMGQGGGGDAPRKSRLSLGDIEPAEEEQIIEERSGI